MMNENERLAAIAHWDEVIAMEPYSDAWHLRSIESIEAFLKAGCFIEKMEVEAKDEIVFIHETMAENDRARAQDEFERERGVD